MLQFQYILLLVDEIFSAINREINDRSKSGYLTQDFASSSWSPNPTAWQGRLNKSAGIKGTQVLPLSNWYVLGLTEAEGCFSCYFCGATNKVMCASIYIRAIYFR